MIDYAPLWDTMKEKGMGTYKLINEYSIMRNTIFRLKHNKPITTKTLDHLCDILDCEPMDILHHE